MKLISTKGEENSKDKMLREMKEIERLQVEAKRREQVTYVKLFGALIEYIDRRRELLKEKISPVVYDIFMRTIDLRNHVQRELLNFIVSSQPPSSEITETTINAYNAIIKEMQRGFLKKYPAIADFPNISSTFNDPTIRLKELDIWMGQIFAFLFSKVLERSL